MAYHLLIQFMMKKSSVILLLILSLLAGCGGNGGVRLSSEERFQGGVAGLPSPSTAASQFPSASQVITTAGLIVYVRTSSTALNGLIYGSNTDFSDPFLERTIHRMFLEVDNGL